MTSELVPAIRRSVASGEFQRATSLWNEYAGLLQREITRGACTAGDMAEAGELVEWARRTVSLARAHAQSRLDALRVADRYLRETPRPAALLRTCL